MAQVLKTPPAGITTKARNNNSEFSQIINGLRTMGAGEYVVSSTLKRGNLTGLASLAGRLLDKSFSVGVCADGVYIHRVS